MSFWTKLSVTSLVMLSFTGVLWPHSVAADENPTVVVDRSSSNCTGELAKEFIGELQLRTSANFVAPGEDNGRLSYVLLLQSGDDESCEVRLENAEDGWDLAFDDDATRPEIASVANRVAWIVDGTHVPEPDSPASHTDLEGISEDEAPQSTDTTEMRNFSVDATGGFMWIPAAEGAVPMSRVRTSWAPRTRLRFGLTGRLPLRSLAATEGDVTHGYRPWAVSLTAGYERQFGERWSLRADGGVRKTIPRLSAFSTATSTEDTQSTSGSLQPENPDDRNAGGEDRREDEDRDPSDNVAASGNDVQADVRDVRPGQMRSVPDSTTPEALTSWAAVTYASLRYAFASDLSLRLDTGIAFSPANRQVADEEQVIMNLGRMELDILLGLDVRF